MNTKALIENWFQIWEKGNFEDLPLHEDFSHTSPFGTMEGKDNYLNIVNSNKEAFLNNKFIIHETIIEHEKACVRYTMDSGDHKMEVSEWFYTNEGLIINIFSYYNIGKVPELS